MNKSLKLIALLLSYWNLVVPATTLAQVTTDGCTTIAPPAFSGPSTLGIGATCTSTSASYNTKYNRYAYHTPDVNTPEKTIMVNINVFQDNSGGNNWQNTPTDLANLNQIMKWVNDSYIFNTAPSDPLAGVPFIASSKIKFEIANIYFYQNTAMSQSGRLNYGDEALLLNYISSINPNRMKQLNICLTDFAGILNYKNTADSISAAPRAFIPSSTNYNYNQIVVLNKSWNNGNNIGYYATSGTIGHELGHCLDLFHTYSGSLPGMPPSCCPETCVQTDPDYLDDVFGTGSAAICLQQTGWSCNPFAAGNTCTNNNMGGCQTGGYFSPKQMAKMHRALSLKSVRRYVKDCVYSTIPKVITANETWDFNIKLYSDIIVEAGATLTIQCNVLMPDEAKIIVKPGAKLVIDGGTITSGCGLMWQGIEVWGDKTKTQNLANQGVLILQNNAIIENAREAVQLTKVGGGTTFNGGYVQATNSTFKNNKRCVSFSSYHAPSGLDNNLSFFNNCVFTADAALKDSSYVTGGRRYGTTNFVTLWDVSNVNFRGCTFQNTGVFDVDIRGTGIYSEDASYIVNALGSGSTIDKTEFINLTAGVYAKTFLTTASKAVQVRNSTFNNVQQGIQGNLSFGAIDNNTFTIPGFVGNPSSLQQWGIYVDGAKGFNITHNTFTGLSLNQNYGVIIKGSASFGGTVAFNTFTGLNFATQTETDNPALKISCNTYTNNTKSWYLNPTSNNGSLAHQGTNGITTNDYRAGNTFNDACSPAGKHIHSFLNNNLNYYVIGALNVFPGTSNKQDPSCYLGNVTRIAKSVSPENSCYEAPPCTTGCASGNRIKMQAETNVLAKYQLANDLINTYNQEGDNTARMATLEEFNSTEATKLLVSEMLYTNNISKAKSYIAQVPTTGKENKSFHQFYAIALQLYTQNKTFYDINATQEATLRNIASGTTAMATNAALVLETVKGETINRQPETVHSATPTAATVVATAVETAPATEVHGSTLYANTPNPFTASTTIRATVSTTAKNPILKITTAVGKTIQVVKLTAGENSIEVNNLNTGLYFYYLIENDKVIDAKKMIMQD
ncbi:MAG: zinc-dependent metalloprotease [Bacteroidia bacterium]